MKKGVPGKLYFYLTGEERFRLTIEALYRGDKAEAKRLDENCPLEKYSTNQAAYTDRFRASREIVNMLCSALTPRLAKLEMIETFQQTVPYVFDVCIIGSFHAYLDGHRTGSRRAWTTANMKGEPPGWRRQEEEREMDGELQDLQRINDGLEKATEGFLRHLATLERELTAEVLAMWGAFVHFCAEELLLEPEKLLKVWSEPMLPRIEKLKNIPDPPEVDQEVFEEFISGLKQMWSSLIQPA